MRNNDLSNCVFLPNTTPPNQTFAWNHGGVQPEIATTWVGIVGPGVEKKQARDGLWSDHTDMRPTMLSLLGLKDSYVTRWPRADRDPQGRRAAEVAHEHTATLEELGAAYKQIMASFGQFSMDTLTASTGALASNTAGDTDLRQTEAALRRSAPDATPWPARSACAVARRVRRPGARREAGDDWIEQAEGLLEPGGGPRRIVPLSASDQKALNKINHIVVIYEENHSFDNLYGGWEGVNGRSNAVPAHTTQVNEAGNAVLVPEAERHQPGPRRWRRLRRLDGGTPGGPS